MYNNEWFSPPENYQDPNEEIIWKRPKYDPWMDEQAPEPVDLKTYLRGRQPSDDPYSEIRRPRTLSETANFNIPYAEEMRDMLVPPQSIEEMLAMYDPGGGLGAGIGAGTLRLLDKTIPKNFPYKKTIDTIENLPYEVVVPRIPKSFEEPLFGVTQKDNLSDLAKQITRPEVYARSKDLPSGTGAIYKPWKSIEGGGDAILARDDLNLDNLLPHEWHHKIFSRVGEGSLEPFDGRLMQSFARGAGSWEPTKYFDKAQKELAQQMGLSVPAKGARKAIEQTIKPVSNASYGGWMEGIEDPELRRAIEEIVQKKLDLSQYTTGQTSAEALAYTYGGNNKKAWDYLLSGSPFANRSEEAIRGIKSTPGVSELENYVSSTYPWDIRNLLQGHFKR